LIVLWLALLKFNRYRVNLYDANVTGTVFATDGTRLFSFTLLVHAVDHVAVLQINPPGAAAMVFLPDRAVPPVCSADPFATSAPSAGGDAGAAESAGSAGAKRVGAAWGARQQRSQAAAAEPTCQLSPSRTPGKTYQFNPNASCTATSCQQKLLGGGDYAVAWGTHKSSTGTFLLTVANSMPAFIQQPDSALAIATATITRLAAADLPASLDAHRSWWHAYWPMHHISVPDTVLEQYYIIQFYKLASATRCDSADNCFAYDLNGPWLEVSTIWADYHYDLNTQVAHWLTMPGNRLREGQSLVEMVARNHANLTRSAQECMPDAPAQHTPGGWCPPKPTSAAANASFADSAFLVTTCGPDMLNNGGWYGFSQKGSLPWICNNLWMTYRYSMNQTLLEEQVYPLLRQATNFYLGWLENRTDGLLHVPSSISPEYGSASDTAWDLSLLRWGLKTLIHIATDLLPHIPAPLLPAWRATLQRLAPYQVDPVQGLMVGAGLPLAHGHRHWSNLFPIFPTYDLRWGQNASQNDLINRSVSWWEHFHPTNGFTYAVRHN